MNRLGKHPAYAGALRLLDVGQTRGSIFSLNRLFSSWLAVRTRWAPGGQDGLVARKDDVGTSTSKA